MIVPYQEPVYNGESSPLSQRQRCEDLVEQMRQERESWRPYWSDLAKFIEPSRGRFWVTDGNRGDRRNYAILDSTATFAARTLASGMMSGITNPARPWFRLTTPDPQMAEFETVKEWLYEVTQRMQTVLQRSNFYDEIQVKYGDLGVFGTSAMLIEEDEQQVIRCQTFPIGSYMIADDQFRQVRYFAREFTLSVSQVIEMFGEDNPALSHTVKALWKQGQLRQQVQMVHIIKPNPDYDPSRAAGKFKPFVSHYWEVGTQEGDGPSRASGFLRTSGYEEFPVMAARWAVTGEDTYATNCPGMVVIGDVRQLQLGEKRKMQAVDKKISPPVQASPAMRNQRMSFAAADVTFNPTPTSPIVPIYNVDFDLQAMEFLQDQVRARIRQGFFADLFLLVAMDERNQRATATEINERREEKFLALGPVLQRLNKDTLSPAIDRIFNIMSRKGMLPPAPPELEGMELKVEFVSLIAQAQKIVAVGGMERFANTVITLSANAQNPSILDKWDADQWVDEYAEQLGVPPTVVRSDDEVMAMRQAQAEAQAQAQAAEVAKVEAEALSKLSQARTGPGDADNMLANILNSGGAVQPQGSMPTVPV